MPFSIKLDNTVPGTWADKEPSCTHRKHFALSMRIIDRGLASVDLHAMQDTLPWACASPQVCSGNDLPQGSYAILKVFLIPVCHTKLAKVRHHDGLGY